MSFYFEQKRIIKPAINFFSHNKTAVFNKNSKFTTNNYSLWKFFNYFSLYNKFLGILTNWFLYLSFFFQVKWKCTFGDLLCVIFFY